MPFEELKYHGNLNKENEENGILVFFFNDKKFFGFLELLPYTKSQIKQFNLLNDIHEISDVFIFEEFRGRGLCKKMIEVLIRDFNYPLKITVENDNIPAIKCYQKYFKQINNKRNVDWLIKNVWKLKNIKDREFITFIHIK